MTASPLLSIVVPNFNNALYLDECLQSIFAQSFGDFEVLVADDGSTDRSPELIRGWGMRHPGVVRPLLSSSNRGVPTNLHQAIEQSRGTWLTTLDADDFYASEDKLEREMAVVRGHEAAGRTVIAYSDILQVRDDRAPICLHSSFAPLRQGIILDAMLCRSCLIPRDFVVARTAYFEAGGYDPRVLLYDDWDLKIRLAERYPFFYSGVTGTAYRQHGKGIASRPLSDHMVWMNRVFERNLHRVDAGRRDGIRADFDRFMTGLVRRNVEQTQPSTGETS